jgi:hypothetical protein
MVRAAFDAFMLRVRKKEPPSTARVGSSRHRDQSMNPSAAANEPDSVKFMSLVYQVF